MQLIGSIIVALAIVAVTISIVTAKLGPYGEDEDLREERQEQIEDDNSGRGN